MTSRLVLRLMAADGRLLGWTEHLAAVRGDGMLRSSSIVSFLIEAPGLPAYVSAHWVDLNIEVRLPIQHAAAVPIGATVPVLPAHEPIIVCGAPATGLPAVTVRSRAVGLPMGVMGAKG